MGKFQDAMNDFGQSNILPEGFADAMNSAYDEDFSSANAKVLDLEGQLVTNNGAITQLKTDFGAQISSLKSANYDLLRAVPKDANAAVKDRDSANESGHGITIADLFGKKEA
jgi:hypothetical protein